MFCYCNDSILEWIVSSAFTVLCGNYNRCIFSVRAIFD